MAPRPPSAEDALEGPPPATDSLIVPVESDGPGVVQRDVVVIGASAGGVQALVRLVAGLPAELPATMFVVLHVMPTGTSVLPEILGRAGPLPAAAARDGERIERGRIYVAPPDYHLLVREGHVELSRGPRENGHRPAVDPLFRSAARAYGPRVIGVLLSGSLDDGTAGMGFLRNRGGATIAQDPADALYPGMPGSAVAHEVAGHVVPIDGMAKLICELMEEHIAVELDPPDPDEGQNPPRQNPPPSPSEGHAERERADDDPRRGNLIDLTCPECGGTLWEHGKDGVLRYKCHVGHAYSSVSLEAEQSRTVEMAMSAALRALEERVDLLRRMARRYPGNGGSAHRLEQKAREIEQHTAVVRQIVTHVDSDQTELVEQAQVEHGAEEVG